MRGSTEKPGNGRSCWAQTLEKMAAKTLTMGTLQLRKAGSAVEASETGKPPRAWAASSHVHSLGSWSGSDAGQRPWRLARRRPH